MKIFNKSKDSEQLIIESQKYFNAKQYKKAKKLLENALTKTNTQENKYKILHLIGACWLYLKDYDKTIEYFKKALELNAPIEREILKNTYYSIGVAFYYKSNYENAIEYLSAYIEINPELIQAYRIRGECYQKVNNFQASISDLELYFDNNKNTLEIEDDFKPLVALSNSYIQVNDIIKGTEIALKAVKINPDEKHIQVVLSTIAQEYLIKDDSIEINSVIKKGELLSQILNLVSIDNSKLLSDEMQKEFTERFQNARQRKPNLIIGDVLSIGANVSIEMCESWLDNIGYINHVQKSYLTYEVAKIIHNFKFSDMEVNEIHKKMFDIVFLRTL